MPSEFNKALKEASVDTFTGMLLNIPVNFALLSLAFKLELSAFATTMLLVSVFTIIALARKVYIRMYFARRYQKNLT